MMLSASSLLNNLHLDNLCLRRKKIKVGIMFKILNGDAPSYLQNLFSVHGSGYNLRNSEIKLNLPKPRTINYLKRSLCYSGDCGACNYYGIICLKIYECFVRYHNLRILKLFIL